MVVDAHGHYTTVPAGLRVFRVLQISQMGKPLERAMNISDDEIRAGQLEMARETGLYTSPEGAATWAALKPLRQRGFLTGDEHVVLFSTGVGIKYEPPPQSRI